MINTNIHIITIENEIIKYLHKKLNICNRLATIRSIHKSILSVKIILYIDSRAAFLAPYVNLSLEGAITIPITFLESLVRAPSNSRITDGPIKI